jgi:hypothetical protein
MYTPEQIQALLAQGYTRDQINAAMGVQTQAAPAPAAAAAPAPQASLDALARALGGAAYGTNADSRRLPDGDHIVVIEAMSYKTGLQYGDRFICEFDLEASSNPEASGRYSIAVDPADKWGYGPDEIKGIIAAANEAKNPASAVRARWEPQYLYDAIAPAQPLKGGRLRVRTHTKIAEKSGKPFVKHENWRAAGSESIEPASLPALPAAPQSMPSLPTLPPMPAAAPPAGLPPLAPPAALPPLGAPQGLPPLSGAPQGIAQGWPPGLPMPGQGGAQ